jgi:hypothetical protein
MAEAAFAYDFHFSVLVHLKLFRFLLEEELELA